ncbi:MAG: glutathione S-transferase family protein [Gammaproteobacteria bacterium]|nr:glutathione S-transferase family protein [Gammaproteobacteria bacterium]
MAELILHHYDGSLFSEKIRAILGYKKLPWRSVIIPPIMPRPHLMPLTGGYRRTPVMQVGADIFCDTHVITEYIDQVHPERHLHPEVQGWTVRTLAQRADSHLFQVAVALCFQPKAVETMLAALGPEMAQKFAEDRAQLSKGSAGVTSMPPETAETWLHDELVRMEAQLAATQWLCGHEPTLADFAVYHCLWLIRNNKVVAPLLTPYARIQDWMSRIRGFGHGRPSELAAEEALEIGRSSEPMPLEVVSGHLPRNIVVGDAVTVMPVDYGLDPVAGRLEYCTAHACGVLREDEQAGTVRVHFPRAGFRIDPA